MSKPLSWKQALSNKSFRIHLIAAGFVGILIILFLPYFFNEILLPKPGLLLNDFILSLLEPKDWSWVIFGLIYFTLLLTIYFNYSKPHAILLGIESYIGINLVRIVTLYFVTLEPPQGIIPLIDPLITKAAYGNVVYLKDLFFSGHVSTLFLLFLIEENKLRKIFILSASILVGFLILWQHVHYTIDVLSAPLFAGIIYSIIRKFHSAYLIKR
ncbi:MAG: hypothetical protein JJE09_04310 [Bacteroidia bacterium]|nr:hypothetical protein [Bacteroidia bacterium]